MSFESYISIKATSQGQLKSETKKTGRSDKWMAVLGLDMSSHTPHDANSGAAKGARQHGPLTITKEWGAASPQLLQAHWNNEVLTEVVIEVVGRSTDGKKEEVHESITLTNAVIVSVKRYSAAMSTDLSKHDVDYLEQIGFRFQKIMVENKPGGTSTTDDWNTPSQ